MTNYTDSRDAIFTELYELALKDKNVIFIACDTGCYMVSNFKKNIPQQYYNFGIAEQNAMSVAAGLAIAGKKPFVYGISNFVSLRCFEQLRVDICGMNLPVTILASGTGYTYSSDGLTHHITDDVSAVRALPNMTIYNASSYYACAEFVHEAYKSRGPVYLRFDKGPFKYIQNGRSLLSGFEVVTQDNVANIKVLVTTGVMLDTAIQVAGQIPGGLKVIDLYRLKPVDENALADELANARMIYTLEEHTIIGGLFSIISEIVTKGLHPTRVIPFGIQDRFLYDVGDREYMRKLNGLDVETIVNKIVESL